MRVRPVISIIMLIPFLGHTALVRSDVPREVLLPWHGLEALAQRQAVEWPALGCTESSMFTDALAGATIMRMTAHPASDHLQYYDVPLWNADGSRLLMRSRERGRNFLLAEADSGSLKGFQDPPANRFAVWCPNDPDLAYFLRRGGDELVRLNVDTGEQTPVADLSAYHHDYRLAPLSHDGRFALLHDRFDGTRPFLVVTLADGSVRELETPLPVCRVRFARSPDHALFLNSDYAVSSNRRTGLVDFRSGVFNELHRGANVHPDMRPDGGALTTFLYRAEEDGQPFNEWVMLDRDGQRLASIAQVMGHQSWSPCGRFIAADGDASVQHIGDEMERGGRFYGQIALIEPFEGRYWPIVEHMSDYLAGRENPNFANQDAHPHAQMSPDGTKIAFNSIQGGRMNPDLYVIHVRLPERPRQLEARPAPEDGIALSWTPPPHAREVARYRVYRRSVDEAVYASVGTAPAGTREFIDPDGDDRFVYAVTAEDFSGLESWPADEAAAAASGTARFSTADEWRSQLGDRLVFDGHAPGFWAVEIQQTGVMNLPAASPGQRAWLLVRADRRTYQWLPLEEVPPCPNGWRIAAWALYPEMLSPPAPSPLAAEKPATPGPGRIERANGLWQLTWPAVDGARWYHIYLVDDEASPLDASTRVGTVREPRFIDVDGYQQDRVYRLTAVGRVGSESAPSDPLSPSAQERSVSSR